MRNLPIHIKVLIGLLIILMIISAIGKFSERMISFFNLNRSLEFEYTKLEQAQESTLDNNYMVFKEKSNIAGLNKETFVEVTKIIFAARTDSEYLAWKWVQENQQVNYEEFTKFYSDLSGFVQKQYGDNNAIELQKQEVVNKHNVSLNTFPGNLYNYFLNLKPLVYKRGVYK